MKDHGKLSDTKSILLSDVCPVSGLKITREPEWEDIPLTDGYSVSFLLIGDRILLTMPAGYSGRQGMAALFHERENMISRMPGGGKKFVELRDYAGVRGQPNWNARRQMVQGLRADAERLLGFISFNMSPPVKLVANVGMRLYRFPFHVSMAVDYRDAINRALKLLEGQPEGLSPATSEDARIGAGLEAPVEQYIDELVRYLGAINWEIEETDNPAAVKADHPFKPVYDAIDLIKVDLEDIIREREASARDLLEKETVQRSIIESIDDGYYECDLAGTVLVVNKAFCKASGFSYEAVVGTNYREKLDEPNAKKVFEAFNQVYRTGLPAHNITYEIVAHDGIRRFVEVTTSLIRDKDGNPTGFRGIVRDISERKKTEESLMMFRRFVEASGEGMSWSDLDGRTVYVNDTMCRILGEPDLASARGKRVTKYYDSDTRKILIHEITPAVLEKGEWKGELLLRQNNGRQVPTLNDIFLIRDETGQPLYFAIISRDISELKKAAQALRKSEEKYRVLYEHAGDAIFVAQDGVVKFPNIKGEALFGFSRKELSGNSFLAVIHPEDQQMVLERHMKRLKGEKLEQTYSFRIFNKAGKMLWVQITSVYIEWEGRPAALVFLRDITRQKTMEEQLRNQYKMEAVGTLAGGIAHDFNNILAGIMGYTDVIAGGIPEGTTAHKNLNQIRKSVMRARGLVKQLLAFSRSAEKDYSPVNMGAVVMEVLEMVRGLSPPSVEIVDKIQPGDYRVYANPVQIHAIVLNLCNNALQAMPEGGALEISLQTDFEPDPRLTEEQASNGRYCQLVVKDTGVGMTPEDRERIFEPYFTTRPPGQGTGLGLSVVHGVVTNLGGFITAASKPGMGSTFRILLPLMEENDGFTAQKITD